MGLLYQLEPTKDDLRKAHRIIDHLFDPGGPFKSKTFVPDDWIVNNGRRSSIEQCASELDMHSLDLRELTGANPWD